jgi:hypothetical protein
LRERWRQRREERREDALERSRYQPIRPGALPAAGGGVFKLVSIAVLVAVFVVAIVLMKSVLDSF